MTKSQAVLEARGRGHYSHYRPSVDVLFGFDLGDQSWRRMIEAMADSFDPEPGDPILLYSFWEPIHHSSNHISVTYGLTPDFEWVARLNDCRDPSPWPWLPYEEFIQRAFAGTWTGILPAWMTEISRLYREAATPGVVRVAIDDSSLKNLTALLEPVAKLLEAIAASNRTMAQGKD